MMILPSAAALCMGRWLRFSVAFKSTEVVETVVWTQLHIFDALVFTCASGVWLENSSFPSKRREYKGFLAEAPVAESFFMCVTAYKCI